MYGTQQQRALIRVSDERIDANMFTKLAITILVLSSFLVGKAVGVQRDDHHGGDRQAEEQADQYDIDGGILNRVHEAIGRIMTLPIEAITLMKTHHRNKGFEPHGLHAEGRDTSVMPYMYSLLKSFETVQVYVGTERGEYFTFFSYEGVYREPGNSGYQPDDPDLSKYYSICTDGNTGELHNCSMSEGMEVRLSYCSVVVFVHLPCSCCHR